MVLGNTGYSITHGRDGVWWFEFGNGWKEADPSCEDACREILGTFRSSACTDSDREAVLRKFKPQIYEKGHTSDINGDAPITYADRTDAAQKLIDFFSEFHFEPNFRFVNTFVHHATLKGYNSAKQYVFNYFSLADSVYTDSVKEKMDSPEFTATLEKVCALGTPENVINKRFKLYFGSQGTGKTVKASKEADDIMVCHSAVLPQDLMEDFTFVDGNAVFTPSALQRAIVEGKKICLDEINLLPYDSLRFLQSILDGKESFIYKGKEIKIADGFQIIGTMNLVVNGVVFSLPEPLIDRAAELVEFKLTAEDLASAFV